MKLFRRTDQDDGGQGYSGVKKTNHASQEVVLEVKNLSGRNFKNISFHLHRGEIVGFAGLVGSGRTEIARAILVRIRTLQEPSAFGAKHNLFITLMQALLQVLLICRRA
jgi:ABC-type sugar transport system ATPase subunit